MTTSRGKAPINGPTPLSADASREIASALNALLADTFALYFKTGNFHWHVSGQISTLTVERCPEAVRCNS